MSRTTRVRLVLFLIVLVVPTILVAPVQAQEESETDDPDMAQQVAKLSWRGIGPAFMSGRITEIAIDPSDSSTWYVSAASGGVPAGPSAATTSAAARSTTRN